MMKKTLLTLAASAFFAATAHEHGHSESHGDAHASHTTHAVVSDKVIAEQRKALANNTKGKGFGPQAPRDIDAVAGNNARSFSAAPASTSMNLCNIHFHKNAEHKAHDFSIYAGNGNGKGYQSGYKADTSGLSKAELAPTHGKVCDSAHSTLRPGDTIEVHYVYTTAQVKPGATLGS